MFYPLLLPRTMRIRDFLDHARETQAADLTGPLADVPQKALARWVHVFDVPDSGLKSVVLWVKAPHWTYQVGFFVCGTEYPEALREEDSLPLDLYLWRGKILEELTPEDLRLAETAVYEFVAAMQGS